MELYMTEGEILTMYKQAKYKYEQVSILAQLNNCNRQEMENFLKDRGIKIPEPTEEEKTRSYIIDCGRVTNRRRRSLDECDLEYMPYYRKGLSDSQIAEIIGVTPATIAAWRRIHHFAPNHRPAKGRYSKNKEKKVQ